MARRKRLINLMRILTLARRGHCPGLRVIIAPVQYVAGKAARVEIGPLAPHIAR